MNELRGTLIESGLNKSEATLVERFANLIKGNEVDLEIFDRMFRNVEDANALAILKNQLAEIATSTLQAGLTTTKQEPTKRKYTPRKPTDKKKESDKDIKQNVQDLGKTDIKPEPDFDL